jgi:hypothetical protein
MSALGILKVLHVTTQSVTNHKIKHQLSFISRVVAKIRKVLESILTFCSSGPVGAECVCDLREIIYVFSTSIFYIINIYKTSINLGIPIAIVYLD